MGILIIKNLNVMLTTPLLEKYRKGDLVQFFNNVLEILTEQRAQALKISPQRKALEEVMQHFNEAWHPNRGSELTPQIEELDMERDTLFIGLKLTVDAWGTYHYEKEKRNAAFLIADKIASYGDKLHKKRYQQETAILNSLLSDLETGLAKEVQALGLTEWVANLRKVNTEFNQKYVERTEATASEQEGKVLELRKEATSVFRKLKMLFEARMAIAEVENSEDLPTFKAVENALSRLVEQYNDAVLRASEMNKKEEESKEVTEIEEK